MRGGTTASKGRGKAPPKFKPKAVRREQSEREKLQAEAIAKETAARVAAEKDAARMARMRGGRGRGDVMGMRRGLGLGRGAVVPSSARGTFGVAPGPFGMFLLSF